MEFNRFLALESNQFYPEVQNKNLIVLHHTVGNSAKSTADYWASTQDHIATAYIVERDGTIYEMFDPRFWAHHIGSKLPNNLVANKRSIGIEIASEGGLTMNNGKLYTYGIISSRTEFKGSFVNLGKKWRDYQYFDAYDELQLVSVLALVRYLCDKFAIPKVFPETVSIDSYNYKPEYMNHKGVCGHAHLRPDKSDVHPLFPFKSIFSGEKP